MKVINSTNANWLVVNVIKTIYRYIYSNNVYCLNKIILTIYMINYV